MPATLVVGVSVLLVAETMVLLDAHLRGWAVVPEQSLAAPTGPLQEAARWVAVHVTPICWAAYVLLLDGLLALVAHRGTVAGSPARARPRRFAFCFAASIAIWLTFDAINFSLLGAWDYHGLPENRADRYLGYVFAFGAICPAMFLTAELIRGLGRGRRPPGPRLRIPVPVQLAVGVAALALPLLVQRPVGTLTLFLAWIFLLDPLNRRLGAPSILGDWEEGRWGRTLALAAAGAVCGVLWETWNYWAAAKWTYDLPFLGPLESVRLFEMPLAGFTGFPPFAIECWVMFQTLAHLLRGPLRLEPVRAVDGIL